jgi:hypothetical protein
MGHCAVYKSFEFLLHDGADGEADAKHNGAADDFEQAAGGEFFD